MKLMSIRPNPNVHHTETSVYPNPNIHHEETNIYMLIQTLTLTSIIVYILTQTQTLTLTSSMKKSVTGKINFCTSAGDQQNIHFVTLYCNLPYQKNLLVIWSFNRKCFQRHHKFVFLCRFLRI